MLARALTMNILFLSLALSIWPVYSIPFCLLLYPFFFLFSYLISKSLLTSVPLSTQGGGGITDPAESGATVSQTTDNFAFTDDITKRVLLSGTVGTQEALVCE